jgi:hypothetical protein
MTDGSRIDLEVKDNVPILDTRKLKKILDERKIKEDKISAAPGLRLREKTPDPDYKVSSDGAPPEASLANHQEEPPSSAKIHNLLTHMPASPKCEICRIAKQRREHAKKGSAMKHNEEAKRFGEITSFDHLISGTSGLGVGITGETVGLVIRDQFTRVISFFPGKTRQTAEVTYGIRQHLGEDIRRCKVLYSDNAREYKRAAKLLRLPWQSGTPRRPTSDSNQESFMRVFGDVTRTALYQAGLPPSFLATCRRARRNITDTHTITSFE